MIPKNFGMLVSVDWNSNKWEALPSQEDIENASFEYVKKNQKTHTFLNFGNKIYPTQTDGFYYGCIPHLWSSNPDVIKSKYVEVVFLKSYNWKDKKNYIVGLYAFPRFERKNVLSPDLNFIEELEMNVKAKPENIILFNNYIELDSSDISKILPPTKKMGKMSYNYLLGENVFKILDIIRNTNNYQELNRIKLALLTSIERKKISSK